jgi:TonB family protein
MTVFVDNLERYTWSVSTGLPGYETPSGTYPARSMTKLWYSKQWDDAPMPHAIFFTKEGHAIHGTDETQKLGSLASHGCVRLAPKNARTLFALVTEMGLENTQIVLNGETPRSEAKVASPAPPMPERKPPQEDSQIAGETPSSEAKAASPAPPIPERKPPHIQIAGETPSSEASVASPAPPTHQIKPPKVPAADVADANAVKSPRRKSGDEMLQPKVGTAATKSGSDKDLTDSNKKSLAHKEKPATRKTASRSRSKPFLVGTPARSLSAPVSPKLADAYAANVYGSLARNKPRSVGMSGNVTVSFAITASGSLRNAIVARSSGKPPLDHAALAIIRRSAPFSPPPGSERSYIITIHFR